MERKSMDDVLERISEILPELKGESFDMVVAIGRGGIIPASIVNQELDLPFRIISINFRDDSHNPRYDDPRILEEFRIDENVKRILLVDDVSKTGKTIDLAKRIIDKDIRTLVVNGKGDYSLYNEECFFLPWRLG